jgi:hypothetical protein
MTKNLVNISGLSDREMIDIIKENMSFKIRFMLFLVGLLGPIFPSWIMLMWLKVFSSLIIDCTDTDEEVIRSMYILAGKVRR